MTIATFVCMGVARAQDPAGVRGRWETDVNLSPRTGVMEKNGLGTFGAECAVRYRLWNRFSAGLGVSVPFMWNELDAIPLYLSGRYEVLPEQRLSPYFLLNAGASCVQQGEFVRQENGLYAYGRAALGGVPFGGQYGALCRTGGCDAWFQVVLYAVDFWYPQSLRDDGGESAPDKSLGV